MSVAGLTVAAAVMLAVQVPVMILARFPPLWIPLSALVLAALTPTLGTAIAWLGARLTRGWEDGRAALVFAAIGFVAGAVWGTLVPAALVSGIDAPAGVSPVTIVVGAGVLAAVTGALGGAFGRLAAPAAAQRPVLVAALAVVVVGFAVLGLLV